MAKYGIGILESEIPKTPIAIIVHKKHSKSIIRLTKEEAIALAGELIVAAEACP